MKKIILYFANFLLYCSAQLAAAQTGNETDIKTVSNRDSYEEQTVAYYMIIAGSSMDHNLLLSTAKDLSKKTGIKYDDVGRIYKDSCMIFPDTISDELYRGDYVFRRWLEEPISIEMNIEGIFFDPTWDRPRPMLMIVAGMFGDKKTAEQHLKIIRKQIPTAYLKKKMVYMGCIH